jgi:putative addiction module component (TIGR02574 family)
MLESAQISQMSVAERLQAMEQLWDALCRSEGEVSSPDWHADILADRKARAERGEARFLTLEQLKARLRGAGS